MPHKQVVEDSSDSSYLQIGSWASYILLYLFPFILSEDGENGETKRRGVG